MAQVPAIDELPWSADALERLDELRQARDAIEWLIEQAVVECRLNAKQGGHFVKDELHDSMREVELYGPISWERIAEALGVTRQSAHRKYANLVP